MTDLRFRDAERTDIAAILDLIHAGAAAPGLVLPPAPDDPATLAAFEAIAASSENRLIVVELDDRIVGTLQITYLPGLANNGRWRCQLESVHVRADLRGQGIGGQMIGWAVARCRERGCGQVQLTSNKLRVDAHRFYQRLGFEKSHEGFKLKL